MAPAAPLGRAYALKHVEKGQLPVWLGSPHATVMILEQDGKFRIRALVIDAAEAAATGAAALANHKPWMPEHYYALGKPTGEIHVESPQKNAKYTLDQFLTVWGIPTGADGRCTFFNATAPCTVAVTSKDAGTVGVDVVLKDQDTLTLTVTST